jgi:Uracil DNA glycosylase superfamily
MIKTVSQTLGCEGCPMRRFNENFVSLQGPNPAYDLNRLVIAEAPGKQESIEGQPLVGGAGQVFNSLLEKAGIRRDGLTIINCLNCRPPDNVFPTDRKARSYISKEDAQIAVDHCIKHHVDPVIRKRDWDSTHPFSRWLVYTTCRFSHAAIAKTILPARLGSKCAGFNSPATNFGYDTH